MNTRLRRASSRWVRLAVVAAVVLGSVAAWQAGSATAAPDGAGGRTGHRAPAAVPRRALDAVAASARARATGRAVVADALTSPTAQTMANPDGSFTLAQSVVPVRVRRNGAWAALDATLVRNADGTVSPASSASRLVLSGGGSGALAVMWNEGRRFALTLPAELPPPVLSGATATYPDVVAGVDLVVTADAQGGFRDVFVVKTPAAAASSALAGLLAVTTSTSGGLGVKVDAAGNLATTDPAGGTVFAAPPPLMWDSAASAVPGAVSTVDGPGPGARVARMAVAGTGGKLRFTAPAGLLSGPATFPLYLDPWYSPSFGNSGWATFGSGFPNDNHWNSTTDPAAGINQIGNANSAVGTALTLFNFPVPSYLEGASIQSATFGITNTHSWACLTSGHDMTVDISAPSTTMSPSNATYSYWSGRLGGNLGSSHAFAHGYNSSCPAAAEPFDVLGTVIGDVGGGKTTQTFALHADSSDVFGFKEFQASSATLTVTYDHPPATPENLVTSPATGCSGGAAGDGSIALYSTATDPDGGQLTTTYTMWKTSDSTKTNLLTPANGVASNLVDSTSGQASALSVPESLMKARSGGAATGFTWMVGASDDTYSSDTASCSFTFDPTHPGAPVVAPTASPTVGSTCPMVGSGGAGPAIGTLCSFTISPNTSGSMPATYSYQLDQAPPVTVATSAVNSSGVAVVTFALPRLVNTLSVTALSPAGNAGPANTVYFDGSVPNPPAVDGDVTHDGVPDLIVPDNSPAGLWLAAGNRDGTTAPVAADIGVNGTGRSSTVSPASSGEWAGSQATTGNYCGNGLQDVLAYYPTGAGAGGGAVLCGDGSAAPLHLSNPVSGSQYSISSATFTDAPNTFAGNPVLELANAANTSGNGTGVPDQLGVVDNYLWLYSGATPSYNPTLGSELTNTPSPDGGYDWNSWTIATAQDNRSGSTDTDMYLWQPSTGTLDLWTKLHLSTDGITLTTSGKYTLATGWHKAPKDTLVLRAADIARNGLPDLYVTDTTTQTATAYLLGSLANNATLTAVSTGLTMPAGDWALNDGAGTTAADAVGTHPATSAAGAGWTTDTVRGTVLNLNGSGGYAATSSAVLDTTKAYTVSAWVKLAQTSTTAHWEAVSQDGATQSGFRLGYFGPTNSWWFSKPCADVTDGGGASEIEPTAATAPVSVNTWTNLVAQFDPGSNVMRLYVNGALVGSLTDTCSPTSFAANGPLAIGRGKWNGANVDFFPGQIGDVEAYQSLMSPAWIASQGTVAPAHRWSLTDGAGTSAADTHGDTATLSGGASWATDPNRGTVLNLNGTTGAAAAKPALSPNVDFTVSAWVKPTTLNGGVVFSQDGTNDSAFLVYTTATGWAIGLNTDDTQSWSFNGATGGSATAGVWSQLTLTYTSSTGVLTLYVNGLPVATVTETGPPTTTGPFQIGADLNDGARGAYFNGEISDVQVWNAVVPPFLPAMLSGTTKLYQSQATGRCLDGNAAGGMYSNPCQPGNGYQTWTMYLDANGFYRMQSQATGRCLDGNTAGSIYSSPCDATNGYQHWYLWFDGTYYQLQSQATGLCLDGDGAGNIYSNACDESRNPNGYQHWK